VNPKLKKLLDSDLDLSAENDATLGILQTEAKKEFDKLDGDAPSDDALSQMEALAAAGEDIASVVTERATLAKQRAGKAAELRSRVTGKLDNATDDDADDDADDDESDDDEPPAETAPKGKSKEKAVTASAGKSKQPTRAELAARSDDKKNVTPYGDGLVAGGALVASADMLGLGAGETINWRDLATAMSRRIEMMGGGAVDRSLCASLIWEYPEERRLSEDPWDNADKLNEMFSVKNVMQQVEDRGMAAIVAAGGVCDPVPVDYNIPIQSVTDRPVRDGLPSFQATRGGVRFITPPTFASVGTSSTMIWTSAIDATATSATPKPIQEFTCPTTVQELVDAIPTRLQFSNMQARFAPEIVAANTQLALANAARVAEQNLLAKLSARSTIVGAIQVASFTRDLLALLEMLAQGYRYRNRLPDMFPLRFMAPAWVKGAIRTDLLRELPHGNSNGPDGDAVAVADAYINQAFSNRGVIPTWTLDGLAKSVAGSTLSASNTPDAWPDQFFGPLAAGALPTPLPDASANSAVAYAGWPKRLSFFLFAEGTFVYLDGGRIDLGVIRDSVLNNVNKYQTFVEPFEGIAKRGYESIQCTVPLALTGTAFSTAAAPNLSAMPY
jgi:hypothetical protein